jgi:hypothetical protein
MPVTQHGRACVSITVRGDRVVFHPDERKMLAQALKRDVPASASIDELEAWEKEVQSLWPASNKLSGLMVKLVEHFVIDAREEFQRKRH